MTLYNHDCTLCPLYQDADTVCMEGSGPTSARLMIVGEAPGYNEDRLGRPFVGDSGKLLDRELAAVGLAREDIFVTNAVKCRPPDNRKPSTAERKACKPYLEAEVAAIKPALMIVTGNSAMQAVLGTSGITQKMNAVYDKDGTPVLPILHPAAVLRDPTYMGAFRSGLQLAKRVLDDTNVMPETDVLVVKDMTDLQELFVYHLPEVTSPIAIDIETATTTGRKDGGLEPWAPDWRLDTISFTWESGTSWVLPLEHPEAPWSESQLKMIYEWLDIGLKDKRLIGHNIKFDLLGLRWRGVTSPRAHFDTMVASHLLDENGQHGLKPLARQYLGAGAYEDAIKYDGTDDLATLAKYNGQDTDYTLRLYHIFREKLLANPRLLRIFMLVSMPAVNTLIDVETRGFPVDVPRLRDRHREINAELKRLSDEMLAYVPEDDRPKANWNRSNFLEHFLFETLDLPVVDVTPTDKPSMNRDSLLEIADAHPVVPLLLEYRKWKKWESTYTRPWIERLKRKGKARLYPNYKVTGTVTGRLSSDFQQVPRNNFIRGIIGARKGYRLIEADFSQVELRIAAMVADEPTMQTIYQNGGDIHMEMAVAITGKPAEQVTKEERSRAKPVNFGFLYGMGAANYVPYARAQYGQIVTQAQAEHYRWTFFNRFPKLRDWHGYQRRQVHVLGYVDSPIGRRRRLPAVNSPDKEKRAEAERQAINSPVQGFASDMTLLAMIECERDLLLKELDCQMIGQVHDSIMFEVPEDNAGPAAIRVRTILDETAPRIQRKFGYVCPVPVTGDVAVHTHWGGDD